jgi:hypothetical protein
MNPTAENDAYNVALFKVTIRLSGATDTCYVIARHTEDAVQQVRREYADFNVLYIASIERLAGTVRISAEAKEILTGAFS